MNTFEAWFKGKDFTSDWTSHHLENWDRIFTPRRGAIRKILEVGSYEGRSAVFFLKYFPNSTVTCIDIFDRYDYAMVWPKLYEGLPFIEARFDRNIAEFAERVKKIKGDSKAALRSWTLALQRFDLIYIDGDHGSYSSYQDCALAWPLLRSGGLMIIDDYELDLEGRLPDRPKLGIDRFISENQQDLLELYRGYQIILEKNESNVLSMIRNLAKRFGPTR